MIADSPYTRPIQIGSATLGGGLPFVLIAGPALNRSGGLENALPVADTLAVHTRHVDVPFIFRVAVPRQGDGPATDFDKTLQVLREIRSRLAVPIAIQVNEPQQVARAAAIADLLQIPAARCRDADLLAEAAHTGRPVNIEMDSSLPPHDAINLLDMVAGLGNWNVTLTDCRTRGSDVAVDVREFTEMRESGFPLVVDAGSRFELAEIALGAGVDGVCLTLDDDERVPRLLNRLKEIERAMKRP